MGVENDRLARDIAGVLGVPQDMPLLPARDAFGRTVIGPPLDIDLYRAINRKTCPDIIERMRDKIVVLVNESHVRVFDTFADIMRIYKGTQARIRFIGGEGVGGEKTLDELEAGE